MLLDTSSGPYLERLARLRADLCRPLMASRLAPQSREGEAHLYEVEVDDVDPSLRNASDKVARARPHRGAGGSGGRGFGGGQSSSGGRAQGPWAFDAGYASQPFRSIEPSGGAGWRLESLGTDLSPTA